MLRVRSMTSGVTICCVVPSIFGPETPEPDSSGLNRAMTIFSHFPLLFRHGPASCVGTHSHDTGLSISQQFEPEKFLSDKSGIGGGMTVHLIRRDRNRR